MATATVDGLTAGHVIVGEYLGYEPAREYQDGATTRTARPKVRLLVGTRVEVIPFPDEAALAVALDGVKERDIIAVPVYVNGPWNEAAGRADPPRVSFSARIPRAE